MPARTALVVSDPRPFPSSATAPSGVVPSRNVSVPAGVPWLAETDAERTTGVPGATDCPGEAARLVWVLQGPSWGKTRCEQVR